MALSIPGLGKCSECELAGQELEDTVIHWWSYGIVGAGLPDLPIFQENVKINICM